MGGKLKLMLVAAAAVVLAICGSCEGGTIYRVGDSSGWTSMNLTLNPTFYKSWAASKLFRVGDTIWFEYNREFHSVVRVTHRNFNACNLTAPYAVWATGNDTFTIKRPGHYYFVCGFPGHCSAGQKVDVRVPRPSGPAPCPLEQSSHSSGSSTIASSPAGAQPPKNSASFAASAYSFLKVWFCGGVAFAFANALF